MATDWVDELNPAATSTPATMKPVVSPAGTFITATPKKPTDWVDELNPQIATPAPKPDIVDELNPATVQKPVTPTEQVQTSLITDTTNAGKRGILQGAEAWTTLAALGGADTYEEIASLRQKQRAIPASPAYQQFQQSKEWLEPLGVLIKHPGVALELATESGASYLETTLPFFLVGAAAGAPFAGVGSVPGAAIGAAVGTGIGSFIQDATSEFMSFLDQNGVDTTDPQQLRLAMADPDIRKMAQGFAMKHGIPVALFDALSAGVGGRMVRAAAEVAKKTGGSVARAQLKAGVKEMLTQQMPFGMAGEAGGQIVQSGKITSPSSVIAEAVAEIPGSTIEIVRGGIATTKVNRGVQVTDAEMTEMGFTPEQKDAFNAAQTPEAKIAVIDAAVKAQQEAAKEQPTPTPTPTPTETPKSAQPATPHANQPAVDAFVKTVPGIQPGEMLASDRPQGRPDADAAEVAAQVFGRKKLVWVDDTTGKRRMNGTISEDGSTVFLDRNTPAPLHAIVLHEVTHGMEGSAEHKALSDVIASMAKPNAPAEHYARIKKAMDDLGITDMSDEKKRNELVAWTVEQHANDPSFWQDVMDAAGTPEQKSAIRATLERILNAIEDFIAKAKQAVTGNDRLVRYFDANNLPAVRQAIVTALGQEAKKTQQQPAEAVQTPKDTTQGAATIPTGQIQAPEGQKIVQTAPKPSAEPISARQEPAPVSEPIPARQETKVEPVQPPPAPPVEPVTPAAPPKPAPTAPPPAQPDAAPLSPPPKAEEPKPTPAPPKAPSAAATQRAAEPTQPRGEGGGDSITYTPREIDTAKAMVRELETAKTRVPSDFKGRQTVTHKDGYVSGTVAGATYYPEGWAARPSEKTRGLSTLKRAIERLENGLPLREWVDVNDRTRGEIKEIDGETRMVNGKKQIWFAEVSTMDQAIQDYYTKTEDGRFADEYMGKLAEDVKAHRITPAQAAAEEGVSESFRREMQRKWTTREDPLDAGKGVGFYRDANGRWRMVTPDGSDPELKGLTKARKARLDKMLDGAEELPFSVPEDEETQRKMLDRQDAEERKAEQTPRPQSPDIRLSVPQEERPPNDSDIVEDAEYTKRLMRPYTGPKAKTSYAWPAERMGLRLGQWRVDSLKLADGRMLSQLRLLDPNTLLLSEDLVENNIEGRGEHAKRYAKWFREGNAAPPIEVVETDKGQLKVVNGHRRVAAAKENGVPVLAWVSPAMDIPRTHSDGSQYRYDGDPNKPIIKTGLTLEAWRDGTARRTEPLTGGFSGISQQYPTGFPQFSVPEPDDNPLADIREANARLSEPQRYTRQTAERIIGLESTPQVFKDTMQKLIDEESPLMTRISEPGFLDRAKKWGDDQVTAFPDLRAAYNAIQTMNFEEEWQRTAFYAAMIDRLKSVREEPNAAQWVDPMLEELYFAAPTRGTAFSQALNAQKLLTSDNYNFGDSAETRSFARRQIERVNESWIVRRGIEPLLRTVREVVDSEQVKAIQESLTKATGRVKELMGRVQDYRAREEQRTRLATQAWKQVNEELTLTDLRPVIDAAKKRITANAAIYAKFRRQQPSEPGKTARASTPESEPSILSDEEFSAFQDIIMERFDAARRAEGSRFDQSKWWLNESQKLAAEFPDIQSSLAAIYEEVGIAMQGIATEAKRLRKASPKARREESVRQAQEDIRLELERQGVPAADIDAMFKEMMDRPRNDQMQYLLRWQKRYATTDQAAEQALAGMREQASVEKAQNDLTEWAKRNGVPEARLNEALDRARQQATAEAARNDLFAFAKEAGIKEGPPDLFTDPNIYDSFKAGEIAAMLTPSVTTKRTRTMYDEMERVRREQLRQGLVAWHLREIGREASPEQHKRSLNSYLNELANAGFIRQQNAISMLNQRLIDKGFSEKDATRLAQAIADEYQRLVKQRMRAQLFKRFIETNTPRTIEDKDAINNILMLLESGYITDEKMVEQFAKAYGKTVMSPKVIARLNELSADVKRIEEKTNDPNSDFVLEAKDRINQYLYEQLKYGARDLYWSVRKASALTAISTTLKNMTGNTVAFTTQVETALAQSKHKSEDTAIMFAALNHAMFGAETDSGKVRGKAVSDAWRAFVEKHSIYKHGHKYEGAVRGDPLQYSRAFNVGGMMNPLHWLTYVRYWMGGQDVLFHKTAQEIAAAWETARILRETDGGMEGVALQREVARRMGWGKEFQKFYDQAKAEGWTGRDLAHRAHELQEFSWAASTRELANQFGLRATLNQKPEGVIGSAVNWINQKKAEGGIERDLLEQTVMFTTVSGNAANLMLANSPLGYATLLGKNYRSLSAQERAKVRADVMFKATQGTLLATALLFAFYRKWREWKDDEDPNKPSLPPFAIYGKGSNDNNVRQMAYAAGWEPYTIRVFGKNIPYQAWTPHVMWMSIVANIMDRYQFDKAGGDQLDLVEFADRVALATAVGLPNTLIDQSFLKQMSDILDSVTGYNKGTEEQSWKKFAQYATSPVTGLIPNAAKQIAAILDPRMMDARDLFQIFLREMPVAKSELLNQRLNIFGEGIVQNRTRPFDVVAPHSQAQQDPVLQFLVGRNIGIGTPDPMVHDIDPRTKRDMTRKMTDEEKFAFMKTWGPLMKQALSQRIQAGQYQTASRDDIVKDIRRIRTWANRRAIRQFYVDRKKTVTDVEE
jgi:hypothetical protein